MTEEAGLGGLVGPKERVIRKENAGEAWDFDAGEGMPRVKEPFYDGLDLRAREKSVGDIFRSVGCVASWGRASCKGGIPTPSPGANMAEVSITTNSSMEDAPSCNSEGRVDGGVEEGAPNTREGETEIGGRKRATQSSALRAGGTGRAWLQSKPGGWGVELEMVVTRFHR